MNISAQQGAAITAAAKRVFLDMSEYELSLEIAWTLTQVRLDKKGYISWRSMKLGKLLLNSLSEAQNWRCCYCGFRVLDTSDKQPTLEHVTPKSKKGDDHPDNLVMACKACNNTRSNLDIEDFS